MNRSLKKVEKWINSKGFVIKPGRSYVCYEDEKKITYRPQDRPMTALIGLLHECGHILVSQSMKRTSKCERYKDGYDHPHEGKARPNISAADLVHEEIEAWHRGFMLASRLKVRLDAAAYWREYGGCIKGYFKKAVKRVL